MISGHLTPSGLSFCQLVMLSSCFVTYSCVFTYCLFLYAHQVCLPGLWPLGLPSCCKHPEHFSVPIWVLSPIALSRKRIGSSGNSYFCCAPTHLHPTEIKAASNANLQQFPVCVSTALRTQAWECCISFEMRQILKPFQAYEPLTQTTLKHCNHYVLVLIYLVGADVFLWWRWVCQSEEGGWCRPPTSNLRDRMSSIKSCEFRYIDVSKG